MACAATRPVFLSWNICLQRQYWHIMPLGGIICSAPKAIGQVDKGLYGAGCPYLGVQSLVEQLNKLLMNYGCKTSIGLIMQLSLELLNLEMGISSQPLQESGLKSPFPESGVLETIAY